MKPYDKPITAKIVDITTIGTSPRKDKERAASRRYMDAIEATLKRYDVYDDATFNKIMDAAIIIAVECKTTFSHALRETLAETRRLCEEHANR